MTPPKLHIGTTPLRRDRFNGEFLRNLSESVNDSAVRKSKKATLETLDVWAQSGTISDDEFASLSDYSAAAQARYKELQQQWWKLFKAGETGKPLGEVEAKMAREGNLIARHDRLLTELREANARTAVEALAPGLPGPAGVVAAYAAYANSPTWTAGSVRSTQAILDTISELQSGDSPMTTASNGVQQVHREELWKAMNNTLDKAIAEGKAGNPQELNLQYYELTSHDLVAKIAEAAKAGNRVRLNLDAGRLSFPSKDQDGESYFSLDATPDKLRTILQLTNVPGADIAVSLFPQKKLLNSPTDLMHRKIMRYGDEVLLSGMNANLGSGENIDAGYKVQGPAAEQLTANFARDVQDSLHATLDDIWGSDHIQKFQSTNLRMGKRGFVALFDSLSGPSPAGEILPSPKTLEDLEALAATTGSTLRELVKVPKGEYEKVMTRVAERKAEVELSAKGKRLLRKLIEKTIAATNEAKNVERLQEISLPSGKKVGKTRVDIADQPTEREALTLRAIAEAEEFIYLPGFVITKAIAAAIAARHEQLEAEGKKLDVRVIADSGLYPHGSTPNSIGVRHLEDNGIQPRWSKLERTGWHDRKIHAKQLITDKGELVGSTNFSNQGMRENWETSIFVNFAPGDKVALEQKAVTKAQFEELWDTSFELNSKDHSAFLNRARAMPASEWTIELDRERSVRQVLRQLINYERQAGNLLGELANNDAEIARRVESLVEQGYSNGDAILMAAREKLGDATYRELLDALPGAQQLATLQEQTADWKAADQTHSQDSVAESARPGSKAPKATAVSSSTLNDDSAQRVAFLTSFA